MHFDAFCILSNAGVPLPVGPFFKASQGENGRITPEGRRNTEPSLLFNFRLLPYGCSIDVHIHPSLTASTFPGLVGAFVFCDTIYMALLYLRDLGYAS